MSTLPTPPTHDTTPTGKVTTTMLFVWHLLLIWIWSGLRFGGYGGDETQSLIIAALALLPILLTITSFGFFIARADRFLHPTMAPGSGPDYDDLLVRTVVDLATFTLLALLLNLASGFPLGDEGPVLAIAVGVFAILSLQGLVRSIIGMGSVRRYLTGRKNLLYLLIVASAIYSTWDKLSQTLHSLGSFITQLFHGVDEEATEQVLTDLYNNTDPWAVLALVLVVIALFSLAKAIGQVKQLLLDIKKLAFLLYRLVVRIRHLFPSSARSGS